MEDTHLTPEKIMQLATELLASGIVGTAWQHRVYPAHAHAPATAAELAARAGISVRGAQALVDGLTGFGLLRIEDGKYHNAPESSKFLVEGKPGYMGGFAKVEMLAM